MSDDNDHEDPAPKRDYVVGYGRPPKSTQFQPGQSGNPKGRKRKPKSVQVQMQKVVSRKVKITEGGVTKLLTVQDVIFRTIANKAAKGDLNAAKFVFSLLHAPEYAETDVIDQAGLSPEDQAMLGEMMTRFADPDAPDLPHAQDGVEDVSAPAECPLDQDEIPPDHDDTNTPPNDSDDEDEVDDR